MALKIGIVTEYYYPLLGGITENVHNTRMRFKEAGCDVKIITARTGSNGFSEHEKSDRADGEVIRIGRSLPVYSNGSFGRLSVGKNLRTQLKTILEEEKFDLLHIHSPIVPTLPSLALLEGKCAIVGTFHTFFHGSLIYSAFKGRIQKKGIDRLDGQIVVSNSCTDSLSRYFKLDPRVIPNGVDVDQFSPAVPKIDRFNDGKKTLLFLGRFDPRNGLALMLRAFEMIRAEMQDVRLIVVGSGLLEPYYRRMIPEKLSHDIHFVGPSRNSRRDYYATCDVFCSPVTKASFGVTLLEAMSAGKAIVAAENVGYKEVMSRNEGIFVPPGDVRAFADAIMLLLRDKKMRDQLGKNGRTKALDYSWDKVTARIGDYYREILNGGGTVDLRREATGREMAPAPVPAVA